MTVVVRRLAILPAVALIVLVWGVVPWLGAAGLALDHPAWSRVDNDPGRLVVPSEDSWWPPGIRYEWIAVGSSRHHVQVDPWDSWRQVYVWTAWWAAAAGVTAVSLWRGSVPGYRAAERRWDRFLVRHNLRYERPG